MKRAPIVSALVGLVSAAFVVASVSGFVGKEGDDGAPQFASPSDPPVAVTVLNRRDCDAIRGTDYHSVEERDWYVANCRKPASSSSPATAAAAQAGASPTATPTSAPPTATRPAGATDRPAATATPTATPRTVEDEEDAAAQEPPPPPPATSTRAPAATATAARPLPTDSEAMWGVVVTGPLDFRQRTRDAFEVLERSGWLGFVTGKLASVVLASQDSRVELLSATLRVTRLQAFASDGSGAVEDSVDWYACLLVHEARHIEQYRTGTASFGAWAESDANNVQISCLVDVGAPANQISHLQEINACISRGGCNFWDTTHVY